MEISPAVNIAFWISEEKKLMKRIEEGSVM
jgi:hypothetical protein